MHNNTDYDGSFSTNRKGIVYTNGIRTVAVR